jgi:hypothetical protein
MATDASNITAAQFLAGPQPASPEATNTAASRFLAGPQSQLSPPIAAAKISVPSNRFSVDFFSQKFLSVDLARTSNFVVTIVPPAELAIERYQEVAYLCSAAQMPGRRLATQESKPYGYGPTVKTPYDSMFDDVELTFYIDADRASSLELFHRWLNYIMVNNSNFPDIAHVSRYRDNYKAPKFNIFMISKYAGMADPNSQFASVNDADIQKSSLAVAGSPIGDKDVSGNSYALVQCELFDAFPIEVGQIQLDWADDDQIAKCTVRMAFRTAEYTFGDYQYQFGKHYYAKSAYETTSQGTEASFGRTLSDLVNSITNGLDSAYSTLRGIKQFQTNFRLLRNAGSTQGRLDALLGIVGADRNNSAAVSSLRNLNTTIINGKNLVKNITKTFP